MIVLAQIILAILTLYLITLNGFKGLFLGKMKNYGQFNPTMNPIALFIDSDQNLPTRTGAKARIFGLVEILLSLGLLYLISQIS